MKPSEPWSVGNWSEIGGLGREQSWAKGIGPLIYFLFWPIMKRVGDPSGSPLNASEPEEQSTRELCTLQISPLVTRTSIGFPFPQNFIDRWLAGGVCSLRTRNGPKFLSSNTQREGEVERESDLFADTVLEEEEEEDAFLRLPIERSLNSGGHASRTHVRHCISLWHVKCRLPFRRYPGPCTALAAASFYSVETDIWGGLLMVGFNCRSSTSIGFTSSAMEMMKYVFASRLQRFLLSR